MIKDEVIQLLDIFDKGFRSNTTMDRTELPERSIKDIIDEFTKMPFYSWDLKLTSG